MSLLTQKWGLQSVIALNYVLFIPHSVLGLLSFGMWPLRVFVPCCLLMIDLKTLKCSGISLNFALFGFYSINTLKSSVEVKIIWLFFRFMSTLTSDGLLSVGIRKRNIDSQWKSLCYAVWWSSCLSADLWILSSRYTKNKLIDEKMNPRWTEFFWEFKEIHVTGRTEWNVKQNKTTYFPPNISSVQPRRCRGKFQSHRPFRN